MIGGDVGRIAAVIGADEDEIAGAEACQERAELGIECLQRFGVADRIVAMSVF